MIGIAVIETAVAKKSLYASSGAATGAMRYSQPASA